MKLVLVKNEKQLIIRLINILILNLIIVAISFKLTRRVNNFVRIGIILSILLSGVDIKNENICN